MLDESRTGPIARKSGHASAFGHAPLMAPSRLRPLALALALALNGLACTAHAAPNDGCAGSPTADCTDVTANGIRYTSGVSTVNVGNGVAGTTSVNAGTAGIELSRSGVSGAAAPDAEFNTIEWDTDGDPDTAKVDVVSQDGSTPHLVDGNFISVQTYDSDGDPATFRIGATTYTGLQLVQHLAANSSDAGAALTGSLTVNNNAGGTGAPFRTTNAPGIVASSTGGNGGSGGCYTVLFWSWCDDAYPGGDAGSVAVNNDALITVFGASEGKHGISATSQGGTGGNGGGWFGLFGSNAGAGGDGGNGALVSVILGANSDITTSGSKSHGVFAQSRGGNGGAGGDPSGLVALGTNGGDGGDAGAVLVVNDGSILTLGWNSHGIYARSVGAGAGSGSDSGGVYAEGGNGGGESSGANVTVNNSGSITTELSDAFGILAQSIGGGGGDGGGAGGLFTVGGRGGSGGGAGVVAVFDSGTVKTGSALSGDRATAIFAQSIGGGGGNGGDAVSASEVISVAVGGAGGLGGDGNNVVVIADGSDIDTSGNDAHGIHAQSVGGGGGNGGVAVSGKLGGSTPYNISVALGGNGGDGGDAGALVRVETLAGTTLDTTGIRSYGILAQSIGGGGGNGSTALSAAGGAGLSVAVSIGGKGGVAGTGHDVDIDNAASITTTGDLSAGIFTQSIGGGGGNGGYAGSLAVGGSSASVSLGGTGADGGAAGKVYVDNTGLIDTGGQGAAGIFAQSIGGGGGNGGSALAGSIGLASVSTTVGGGGGAGNFGNLVDIYNGGEITTGGNNSAGIFAQSVGGGGGSGGDATSLALAGPVAIAVAVGGDGGSGGNGGAVIVDNAGLIEVSGPNSDGVFAQSVGGSGGAGGSATTGTLVFPIEIEGVEIPAISANVSVGGLGATGGTAGTVTVTNSGEIETGSFLSNGVFAQSVGGSGGKGGHATNISLAFDATFTGKVAVGGDGGSGGTGNTVTVDNGGLIHTLGDFSSGVLAQSVGGGGGTGGNATNISLSLTPPPTSPEDFIPSPSANFDLAVGGNGGDAAIGGTVDVENSGSIVTEGHFATGVMAQSVGGSGGIGGDARSIQVELTADPLDFLPLTSLTSLDMTMVFGGNGGSGSNGGLVTVTNTSNVATGGAFAHGIVAQSVGGGGGSGGSAMTFEFSNADVVPEIPVLDDISGLTTLEMTLQGSGGGGGNGGVVTLNSTGTVHTSGDFAMGVVGQSVGGGGGLAGFYNPQGVTGNEIVDALFNTFVDTEAGLSFAGSVGGAGNASAVTVNHSGNIQTEGDGAHGIFAQSVAGIGSASTVGVSLTGTVEAPGTGAYGIYAQSGGGSGNGAVSVTVNAGGSVTGGSGSGAGVVVSGGTVNTVTNRGSIVSVAGTAGRAIVGDAGSDTVHNHGTVTGTVELGSGANAFNNLAGSVFNAGSVVTLGSGNLLHNAGRFAPGADGAVLVSTMSGNYTQSAGGVFAADLDLHDNVSDRLDLGGAADLAGTMRVRLVNAGWFKEGNWQTTLLTSAGGVSDAGLVLDAPASVIVSYTLTPAANEVALGYDIDFTPSGLTASQSRMANYVNAIQQSGGSEAFAPFAAELVAMPDAASLGAAYDRLSPEPMLASAVTAVRNDLRFSDALHSCRVREGEFRFVREGECGWARLSGSRMNQDHTDTNLGFDRWTHTLAAGGQKHVDQDWSAGFGFSIDTSTLKVAGNARSEGNQYALGAIGKRIRGASSFTASVSLAYGDYDTTRRVGTVVAQSEQDVGLAAAHLRWSQDYMRDNVWYLRPLVDVGVTHVYHGSYDEQGAGGANIRARSGSDTLVSLQPGLEFGREYATAAGTLVRPYGMVGLTRFVSGTTSSVTAALQGAPVGTAPFTVESKMDKTYADLTLGVDVLRTDGMTFRVGYSGQFSENTEDHSAMLKVAIPF
jgi:hypothetical protein